METCKQKILDLLQTNRNINFRCKTIAEKIDSNINTTRSRCWQLTQDHLILNPKRGIYCGFKVRSGMQRIIDLLQSNPNCDYKCKKIAFYVGLSERTTRKYCLQLAKAYLILHPRWGVYCGINRYFRYLMECLDSETLDKPNKKRSQSIEKTEVDIDINHAKNKIRDKRTRIQKKKVYDKHKKRKGCTFCGYNKCAKALGYHHLYDKLYLIDYCVFNSIYERRRKEIKKCILLCSNCHNEEHNRLNKLTKKEHEELEDRLRNHPRAIKRFVEERKELYYG